MDIPGYDQNPPQMKPPTAAPQAADAGQQGQGDGLHHHTIDEDEGGGFHSSHTFPDGRQEMSDHVDYQDAKEKQDADFGCGSDDGGSDDGADDNDPGMADDGEDSSLDGGMDGMNVAKSYAGKAKH